MADFFTHFSCILDVGTAANAIQAVERYHAFADQLQREHNETIGFMLRAGPADPKMLWIHDETDGDPQHVISFVSELGPVLGLKGLWGFEWAHTCSRRRYDSFGGGAHVLDLTTGKTAGRLSTNEWLTRMLADPDNAEED